MKNISLFDSNGRGLVVKGDVGASPLCRHYFQINNPLINLPEIHKNLQKFLEISISLEKFEKSVGNILSEVKADPALSQLLNAPYFPFALPKMAAGDIGKKLEELFIPALKLSYKEKFPTYDFVNQVRQDLNLQIRIIEGSRHENLVAKLNNGEVVGIIFPALIDFSIEASLNFLNKLPAEFTLCGGYDTFAAFIGNPGLLFNEDAYPPMLWASALENLSNNFSYYLEAYGYDLNFNARPHFGSNFEYWVNSLTLSKQVK
jgi:hypothetical protein